MRWADHRQGNEWPRGSQPLQGKHQSYYSWTIGYLPNVPSTSGLSNRGPISAVPIDLHGHPDAGDGWLPSDHRDPATACPKTEH